MVYLGPFSRQYRDIAVVLWTRLLDAAHLPRSFEVTCVDLLAEPAQRRGWVANGLPSDGFSMESAGIILKANSWPLIIDPQVLLQNGS